MGHTSNSALRSWIESPRKFEGVMWFDRHPIPWDLSLPFDKRRCDPDIVQGESVGMTCLTTRVDYVWSAYAPPVLPILSNLIAATHTDRED